MIWGSFTVPIKKYTIPNNKYTQEKINLIKNTADKNSPDNNSYPL